MHAVTLSQVLCEASATQQAVAAPGEHRTQRCCGRQQFDAVCTSNIKDVSTHAPPEPRRYAAFLEYV